MSKTYIDFGMWCDAATVADFKAFFTKIKALKPNYGNTAEVKRYFDSIEWLAKLETPTSDGGTLKDAKAYLTGIFAQLPQEKDEWFK